MRVIYKYALDRIPKQQAQELFKFYTMFEKKFGDRRGIEDVIVSKRRFQYEEEVKVHRPQHSTTSAAGSETMVNVCVCVWAATIGQPAQLRCLV